MDSQLGKNESLCPRTGEICEVRGTCVIARDQAHNLNRWPRRLMRALTIGMNVAPGVVEFCEAEVAYARAAENELNSILERYCGSAACIVEGSLMLPQNREAEMSMQQLRGNSIGQARTI